MDKNVKIIKKIKGNFKKILGRIKRFFLNSLKIFLEKNYSKVVFGYLVVNFVVFSSMTILSIGLHREFFIISFVALVLVLRNDFYWWLFKIGYWVEIKLKRAINYESFYADGKQKEQLMQLINAVFNLAETRTGALISFERQTPLVDYYSSAVILNADISYELIISIFNTKIPLHDGGVIISKNKVKAAGCFYPISKRTNIRKDLGSRHRAAFGLSEVTDSLTILVSEEKGKVFTVFEGILSSPIESKSQLYELLLEKIG